MFQLRKQQRCNFESLYNCNFCVFCVFCVFTFGQIPLPNQLLLMKYSSSYLQLCLYKLSPILEIGLFPKEPKLGRQGFFPSSLERPGGSNFEGTFIDESARWSIWFKSPCLAKRALALFSQLRPWIPFSATRDPQSQVWLSQILQPRQFTYWHLTGSSKIKVFLVHNLKFEQWESSLIL